MSAISYAVSDSLVLARRNLSHVRQVPERLIDVTVQPLMFVLLFAYVFGGAIALPGGGNYHEFLMGGIFVQTMAFGIVGPATGMATDLAEGLLDRLLSLPMARPAFVLGHILAEMASFVLAIAVMTVAGLIVGWTPHAGVLSVMGAYGLLLLFAFTILWVGMFVGLAARSADAVTGIVFLVIFPLTFISNAFVPASTLPGVLKTFAEWNPISTQVAAVRHLFGNPEAATAAVWPMQHPVVASLLWSLVILAAMVPLTLSVYRKRTRP